MAFPATMAMVPGHSLGPFVLGASLHEVLTLVKTDSDQYPAISIHHSQVEPLNAPVIVSLPDNGLRLQFDGPDQRLRLIEVLDFRNLKLQHKGSDLIKTHDDIPPTSGPVFKRVYTLLGPSYPGEYAPPQDRSPHGTYVLSWHGVAFNFPVLHAAWSPDKDFVSLLGSHIASPAASLALFAGKSWPEARRDLFVTPLSTPRLSALASRPKDSLPAEIEHAHIQREGAVELVRRAPAGTFTIVLNETTTQDLTAELGPPDATHRRQERVAAPLERDSHMRNGSSSRPRSNGRAFAGSQPSSYSSTGTDTFETDFDSGGAEEDAGDRALRQRFWCYFTQGLDILVGPPEDTTTRTAPDGVTHRTPLATSPHLVVLRVVIHGNVPGSYAFNRHRRLQWSLTPPGDPGASSSSSTLTSEQHFDDDIKPVLLAAHANGGPEMEMGRGKVVNRKWAEEEGSESSYFLPDAGEDLEDGGAGSDGWLGNTKLFAFPGLTFE
ncbi:hypothetical protein LTR53_008244, partial [Teratosphaeriaceae sp. CCFEE 6253]